MFSMRLTCPELAQPAEVEFETDAIGLLIRRCSGCPSDTSCARSCAARLDRKQGRRLLEPGTVLHARSVAPAR
jgi:hypothetical protein